MKLHFLLFLLLSGVSVGAPAAEANVLDSLTERLSRLIPDKTPDQISETPVKGVYEAVYGQEIFYLTADARYLFRGDLIDLNARENLTEDRRGDGRRELLSAMPESSMIVYKPKGEVKHVINVFTDVDCGYCRKLHSRMADLNALGIEVRYLAFPRGGVRAPSYQKMVNVWCATDQLAAMNRAKSGEVLPDAQCANPVLQQYALGEAIGIRGTPAILLNDGRLIPGYREPKDLLAIIEQ